MAEENDVYILSSSSDDDTNLGRLAQRFHFTSDSAGSGSPVKQARHGNLQTIRRGRGKGFTRKRKCSQTQDISTLGKSVQDSPIAKAFNRAALRKSVESKHSVFSESETDYVAEAATEPRTSQNSTFSNSPVESWNKKCFSPWENNKSRLSQDTVTYSLKHSKRKAAKTNAKNKSNSKESSSSSSGKQRSPILDAISRMKSKKPPSVEIGASVPSGSGSHTIDLDSSFEDIMEQCPADKKYGGSKNFPVKDPYAATATKLNKPTQTMSEKRLKSNPYQPRQASYSKAYRDSVRKVGPSSPDPVIEDGSSDEDFELPSFIPASKRRPSSLPNRPAATESSTRQHGTRSVQTDIGGDHTKRTEAHLKPSKTSVPMHKEKTGTSSREPVDEGESSDDVFVVKPGPKRKRKTPRRTPLKLSQEGKATLQSTSLPIIHQNSSHWKDSVIAIPTDSSGSENCNDSITVIPESDGSDEKNILLSNQTSHQPLSYDAECRSSLVSHENPFHVSSDSEPETQTTSKRHYVESSDSDVDLETLLKSKQPIIRRISSDVSNSSLVKSSFAAQGKEVEPNSKNPSMVVERKEGEPNQENARKHVECNDLRADVAFHNQCAPSNLVLNSSGTHGPSKQLAKKSLTPVKRIFSPIMNLDMFGRMKKHMFKKTQSRHSYQHIVTPQENVKQLKNLKICLADIMKTRCDTETEHLLKKALQSMHPSWKIKNRHLLQNRLKTRVSNDGSASHVQDLQMIPQMCHEPWRASNTSSNCKEVESSLGLERVIPLDDDESRSSSPSLLQTPDPKDIPPNREPEENSSLENPGLRALRDLDLFPGSTKNPKIVPQVLFLGEFEEELQLGQGEPSRSVDNLEQALDDCDKLGQREPSHDVDDLEQALDNCGESDASLFSDSGDQEECILNDDLHQGSRQPVTPCVENNGSDHVGEDGDLLLTSDDSLAHIDLDNLTEPEVGENNQEFQSDDSLAHVDLEGICERESEQNYQKPCGKLVRVVGAQTTTDSGMEVAEGRTVEPSTRVEDGYSCSYSQNDDCITIDSDEDETIFNLTQVQVKVEVLSEDEEEEEDSPYIDLDGPFELPNFFSGSLRKERGLGMRVHEEIVDLEPCVSKSMAKGANYKPETLSTESETPLSGSETPVTESETPPMDSESLECKALLIKTEPKTHMPCTLTKVATEGFTSVCPAGVRVKCELTSAKESETPDKNSVRRLLGLPKHDASNGAEGANSVEPILDRAKPISISKFSVLKDSKSTTKLEAAGCSKSGVYVDDGDEELNNCPRTADKNSAGHVTFTPISEPQQKLVSAEGVQDLMLQNAASIDQEHEGSWLKGQISKSQESRARKGTLSKGPDSNRHIPPVSLNEMNYSETPAVNASGNDVDSVKEAQRPTYRPKNSSPVKRKAIEVPFQTLKSRRHMVFETKRFFSKEPPVSQKKQRSDTVHKSKASDSFTATRKISKDRSNYKTREKPVFPPSYTKGSPVSRAKKQLRERNKAAKGKQDSQMKETLSHTEPKGSATASDTPKPTRRKSGVSEAAKETVKKKATAVMSHTEKVQLPRLDLPSPSAKHGNTPIAGITRLSPGPGQEASKASGNNSTLKNKLSDIIEPFKLQTEKVVDSHASSHESETKPSKDPQKRSVTFNLPKSSEEQDPLNNIQSNDVSTPQTKFVEPFFLRRPCSETAGLNETNNNSNGLSEDHDNPDQAAIGLQTCPDSHVLKNTVSRPGDTPQPCIDNDKAVINSRSKECPQVGLNTTSKPARTVQPPQRSIPTDPRLIRYKECPSPGILHRQNKPLEISHESNEPVWNPALALLATPEKPRTNNVHSEPIAKVTSSRDVSVKTFLHTILQWNPSWLEEREKINSNQLPPLMGPQVNMDTGLFPLLDDYDSYDDYREIIERMLVLETFEQVYKSWQDSRKYNKTMANRLMNVKMMDYVKELQVMTWLYQGLMTREMMHRQGSISEGDLVVLQGQRKITDKKDPTKQKMIAFPVLGYVNRVLRNSGKRQETRHPHLALCLEDSEPSKALKKGVVDPTRLAELSLLTCNKVLQEGGIVLSVNITFNVRKNWVPLEGPHPIKVLDSLVGTLRNMAGLAYLPRSRLARDLLRPVNRTSFSHPAAISGPLIKGFNASQSAVIGQVTTSVLEPYALSRISLVQGPPGTGKSHTIVGLVKSILSQRTRDGIRPRILLTAPSNGAIDELLKKLVANRMYVKNGVETKIKVVRVGKLSSINSSNKCWSLDDLVISDCIKRMEQERMRNMSDSVKRQLEKINTRHEELSKRVQNYQKQGKDSEVRKDEAEIARLERDRRKILGLPDVDRGPHARLCRPDEEEKIRRNILINADVVCCTLNSSGSDLMIRLLQPANQRFVHFTAVIIDEACQCTELDCLIPLQYGCTKLVLVGDPEQLPPTVLSQKASDNKFGQSLFERLYHHFSHKDDSPVLLLDTQYRMHPSICHFANKHVYYGKLKTDPQVADRRENFTFKPYLIFDLKYSKEESGISVCNHDEVNAIGRLCELLTKNSIHESQVGVVTPYQQQKQHLQRQLEKRGLRRIEVNTVDGFQGREKDVIILSCVRARSNSGNIGFLKDRRRMNVALTRAKYALYIFGHLQTLKVNADWRALIEDACKRRVITAINSFRDLDQVFRNTLHKERKR